jgi:NAD(P)-dependent dehydrogenase (short-subunit alcohol dehydrogenase family)
MQIFSEAQARQRKRRVDACLLECGSPLRLTWEQPRAEWQRNFDVNVWGVINGIRTFVPI